MFSSAARAACWNRLSKTRNEVAGDVFAILDGARARTLPGSLIEQEADFACLLQGETDPAALTRAPYVVRVPADSRLWFWLTDEGWGNDWGIYALGRRGTSLDTVLRDLRECLTARLPDGRTVLFRFFDPRVWRLFFPTCDAAQMRLLFGRAITAFACEGESGSSVLLDEMHSGRPQRAVFELPS